ncbi:MAG: hypothetical protein HY664_06345 [Chloroflexi bacterium]|nr:hypothetical protein [Chloroflexota bacterium]
MPKRSRQAAARYAAQGQRKRAKRPPIHRPIPPRPDESVLSPSSPSSQRVIAASPQTKTPQVDYSYVITELRRIAIIGGGMLAIIITLAFILR